MPTMRLRLGLRPGPHWRSLQRSPVPLAGKGEGPPPGRRDPREGEEEEGEGRGGGRGKLLPPDVRFYG